MKQRWVLVRHLRPGDLVDLEGDAHADPVRRNPILPFEGLVVVHVTRETPDCIAVHFEGFDVVGFPAHHRVRLMRTTSPATHSDYVLNSQRTSHPL